MTDFTTHSRQVIQTAEKPDSEPVIIRHGKKKTGTKRTLTPKSLSPDIVKIKHRMIRE